MAFTILLAVPAPLALGLEGAAPPRMAELPASIQPSVPAASQIEWLHIDGGAGIEIGRITEGGAEGLLALRPVSPLKRPDVLVYWLAEEPADGDGVPDDALFAGRLDGARPSPARVGGADGGFLLFSLGHQERVGWVDLGAVQ